MTITMADVVNFCSHTTEFSQVRLGPSAGVKMAKLLRIMSEQEQYYREGMTKILKEYAELDENGEFVHNADGHIAVREGAMDDANAAINELLSTEINIEDISFTEMQLSNAEWDISIWSVLAPFIKE